MRTIRELEARMDEIDNTLEVHGPGCSNWESLHREYDKLAAEWRRLKFGDERRDNMFSWRWWYGWK